MIKIGNDSINTLYVGNDDVDKMYLGSVEVFSKEPAYSEMPLTFNIISGGTIRWVASNTAFTKTIEYKLNDGEWTSITSNTGSSAPSINVIEGDEIQFRGDNASYGYTNYQYSTFSGSTAGFEVEGNIMSLIDSTGFTTATTLTSRYTFFRLFRQCTGLTSVEHLILPATTLTENCYAGIFSYCTSLTTAPELPATTMAISCYYTMFYNCTSLTTAPELPATTVAGNCYDSMFEGCSSLTTAPELPAITLARACYEYMFEGCTSLTTAPELPATTLTNQCYSNMFQNCTSLNYIKCLATDISATNCTNKWVSNVAASGTFIKATSMNDWTTGDSGIPTGWTVTEV